jgi:GTP cyclohydrolase I
MLAGMGAHVVTEPWLADAIVDDLYDSGRTTERYRQHNKPFAYLFDKRKEFSDTWLVFPWETEDASKTAEDHVARLLETFGQDVNREGLAETPKRYVKFMREFLSPPDFNLTTFENEAEQGEGLGEMIIVSDIDFHSLCEHHLAPFFGKGAIAYVPSEKIVGISKLARTLEYYSRRLQNQERITDQVADFLCNNLNAQWVGVHLKAQHMCMSMRGVRKPGAVTTTTSFKGPRKTDLVLRGQFLGAINGGK